MRYIAFFFSIILLSCSQPNTRHTPKFTPQSTGKWWLDEPIRLIQTNLPETNVEMDIDAYVRSLVESSANTVLVNVGGIVCNYPSELPFHYVNKRMKIDFIKAVTEKCRKNNIRIIGRFDFSKINEELAFKKKDWLYKSVDGNFVNYNGQVHACINGGYQQEYSFKILEEAITKYKLDGIFFNMIGYQTRDYSGNYHGICQCDACKKRFYDSTGLTLPTVEDMNNKTFRLYKDFKSATASNLFYRINDHIKTLDSNLAICTYTSAGVDIRRRESGTHISHEIEWNYSASDHIKIDQSMWNDKVTSNGAVHFMSIPYRHIATSPNTTRIRLAENILNGGNLDFYCIGTLINQEDRTGLDVVKDVYGFHKENEAYFTQTQPYSKVCIIKDSRDEYRGIFKMLSEEHILFDVLFPQALTRKDSPKQLTDYEVIILSNTKNLSLEQCLAIDNYAKNGGKVLATGFPSVNDAIGNPLNKMQLQCLGVAPEYSVYKQQRATYLKLEMDDKKQIGTNYTKDFELAFVFSDIMECNLIQSSNGIGKIIKHAMHGPPEKCYYSDGDISETPGIITSEIHTGKSVFFPWMIGELYNFKGNHAHKALFMGALKEILNYKPQLITDAPPLIEMTRNVSKNGHFEWIGMVNHSGQIGMSHLKPIPIHYFEIQVEPLKKVKSIRLLRENKSLPVVKNGHKLLLNIQVVKDFEVVVLEYDV